MPKNTAYPKSLEGVLPLLMDLDPVRNEVLYTYDIAQLLGLSVGMVEDFLFGVASLGAVAYAIQDGRKFWWMTDSGRHAFSLISPVVRESDDR